MDLKEKFYITVSALCLVLGVTCLVYLLNADIHTRSMRRALSMQQGLQRPKHPNFCKTDVCVWKSDYLWNKLDETIDPCDDFYSFVCSYKWFNDSNSDVSDLPFQDFATGQLILDVESVFKNHLLSPGVRYGQWHFFTQSASFMDLCRGSTRETVVSLKMILQEVGLDGWPYENSPENISISYITGTVDRVLGVLPFVEVALKKEFDDEKYQIELSSPETVFKRFMLKHSLSHKSIYEAEVARHLSEIKKLENPKFLAKEIVSLEEELERAMQESWIPLSKREMNLNKLSGGGSSWNWTEYLSTLFKDVKDISEKTIIRNRSPSYLSKFPAVLSESSIKSILNYVGFKMMTKLAALLPQPGPFMLDMSHGLRLKKLTPKLKACLAMLQQIYRYGSRIIGKITFGRQFPFFAKSHYDLEVSALIKLLKTVLIKHVQVASWMNYKEKQVAQRTIKTMTYDFTGTVPSLYWPALYYGVSSPRLNHTESLTSVYRLLSHTRRRYLNSSEPNLDFDARSQPNMFRMDCNYISGRNLLQIPPALVSFLNHMSNKIYPVFTPVIGSYILRNMFLALSKQGAEIKDGGSLYSWWSRNTTLAFDAIEKCVRRQYLNLLSKVSGSPEETSADLSEIVSLVASMPPLYEAFVKNIDRSQVSETQVSKSLTLEMDQLFFVMFGVGMCEETNWLSARVLNKFRALSPVFKVNVVLMNFPKFAAAFSCQKGSKMRAEPSCKVF